MSDRRPWFVLRRILQLLAVGGVGALLALLSWRLVAASGGGDLVSSIRTGKQPVAPSFRLPVIWPHTETWPSDLRSALADGTVSPGELRGYPVVINFWASWCVPCKAEAPRLVASARRHSGKVAFLAIDVQDFKSDAKRFLRHFHADYVSVRDGGGSTYVDYGLTGVPETYYLGPSGRIAAHSTGEVSSRELEAGIALAVSRERSSTLAAEGPPPGPYKGSEPPPGIQAPDFALRSYRGPLVRMRALRGKVVVVTFLDTKCTQQCPIIAGLIGRAIPLLSAAERRQVEALAISVNPRTDNSDTARVFLQRRHALGRLDFLLGPVAVLRPLWKAFHILSAYETGNADIHSADVRVFDRRANWVSTLQVGVDLTPQNLVHDIRVALRAKGTQ